MISTPYQLLTVTHQQNNRLLFLDLERIMKEKKAKETKVEETHNNEMEAVPGPSG